MPEKYGHTEQATKIMRTSIVFSAGYLIVLLSVILLYFASVNRIFQGASRSAFHPFNILGFFLVIITVDFSALYLRIINGDEVTFLTYTIRHPEEVENGFLYFVLCAISASSAVSFSSYSITKSKIRYRHNQPTTDKLAALIVFLIALIFAAIVFVIIYKTASQGGSIFHVAAVRQTFFRENQLLSLLYSLLLPATILYISRSLNSKKAIYTASLMAVILVAPVGSRSIVLNIAIALVFAMVMKGVRFPVLALYLLAPAIGVLISAMRYIREFDYHQSFSAMLDYYGGVWGGLFNTAEVSMAEVITVIITFKPVDRGIFDSLIGIFVAPIPRSIIPWKPWPAGTEFTRTADIEYWELVKSDMAVTGFGDLAMSFELYSVGLIIFILFYWWAKILIRAAVHSQASLAMWGPICIIVSYLFVRGDIFIVAFFMWPLSSVLITHRILTRIFNGFLKTGTNDRNWRKVGKQNWL